VILADENGMAGTRPMAELAAWAWRGGAKIIQIVCRQNNRRIDVHNGTRGTIVLADPRSCQLVVRADGGRRLRLPKEYINGGYIEHGYALRTQPAGRHRRTSVHREST
jgi:ATP-dependent exoDNAse (exonuclease V) alpha subunit